MQELSNISVIKSVLAKHGFTFSKALGQNFLVNPSVCPKMAELGGAKKGAGMLEIGAGIGVLTKELAARCDKVVCVEIDSRLMPILDETLADFDNVKIVNEDVLKVDLHKLLDEEFSGKEVAVCANLPYYITSPIIMYLLEERLPISSVTVMVQKEAAARITALPGTREVGAISIAIRYYCKPQVLFQVSRGSFMPSPEVDSTVIKLEVLPQPAIAVRDEKIFFRTVKGAFSQRRKTLVNCISSFFSLPKEQVQQALTELDIKLTARAEELSLEEFGMLADKLTDLVK